MTSPNLQNSTNSLKSPNPQKSPNTAARNGLVSPGLPPKKFFKSKATLKEIPAVSPSVGKDRDNNKSSVLVSPDRKSCQKESFQVRFFEISVERGRGRISVHLRKKDFEH